MTRRTARGVPGILSPNAGIKTAPTPNNSVMYRPMLPQVTYSGTRTITADAINAYHGSPTDDHDHERDERQRAERREVAPDRRT